MVVAAMLQLLYYVVPTTLRARMQSLAMIAAAAAATATASSSPARSRLAAGDATAQPLDLVDIVHAIGRLGSFGSNVEIEVPT
jgi:hypothetical protein